ncbi:MAG TPA: hypothetical protein VF041_01015 [Gemmatimonadaceae bacterium]
MTSITPIFAHAQPEPGQPRLLLLSYHFPPDTTVGARRWEKLATFVCERGWGLDVITRDEPQGDRSRLEALPAGVRVFTVPPVVFPVERLEHLAWRAYRTLLPAAPPAAVSGDGKGAAVVPDRPDTIDRGDVRWTLRPREALRAYWTWMEFARAGRWARRAAALGVALAREVSYFAVVTSGPPHMTHVGGRLVGLQARLPFVMDMRDPWSLNQRLPEPTASPLWLRLAARYERQVVESAALVVANTEPAREALGRRYPSARERLIAVMNGSDDDPLPPSRRGGRFTIGYAGTIYDSRDPRNLFRAAARVIEALALTPADFGIDLIGAFDRPGELPVGELARREGIADYVTIGPARPHARAMEFLAQATMLVTFPGWNTITIPAKTFECVRFDAWLLSLSERGSATDLLLRGTAADVVPPDDVDGIAAVIRKRVEQHRRGVHATRIANDDRFSRRGQARILLDALARFLPRGSREEQSVLAASP